MVIALKSYERGSFIRFFLIYTSVFMLMFIALASLYYFQERQRLFKEKRVEVMLAFNECKRINSLLQNEEICEMQSSRPDMSKTTETLLYTSLLTLIFTLGAGFILARISLKPVRDSVERMDSFINGIVHDINTPLSIVKLNAQSIARRLDDEKLIAKNRRIIQASEHIENLEEQLLFTLKIHHYELQKKKFDLFSKLQERQGYWNDLKTNINVNVIGERISVNADEIALLRMIDNVVINAIKYSKQDQNVTIELRGNELKVVDRGEGIKNPKMVFEKYYRESTKVDGLGLGLFLVYQIAIMHKVKININSQLGNGTTFSFDISSITH
ncbi:hypothetical protein GJV85_00070 [Sulfurimonas aquatica]|uniref:histidine kinase n=1 Tax=Sulfurimonas aquatica TaxID=2672570 RepID=A0A975AXU2_9BACT|nr:HAMP domain-containing sensor histidine kinase [Sulfurimonas aquatica]QSZ40577.1 hypothetical protein GJV85_00070 [Sulfurimonas aquatica]